MNVKVVLLPEGEDPDSFARKQNAEGFHRYIAENEVDFIRFNTQLLLKEVGDDPVKRAGLISNVVESIALIPNTITRSVYIQECAQLLHMQERVLIAETNKFRRRHYERKKGEKEKEPASLPDRDLELMPMAEVIATGEKAPSKNPYEKYEKEILRYLVRYGNRPLYRKYEKQKRKVGKEVVEEDVLVEEGPGVIEFVKFDLERDNIGFTTDLYRRIFDEAVAMMEEGEFDSGRHFLSHADPHISRLASELMSDRYQLSKMHAKILGEELNDKDSRLLEENLLHSYVPRATTELKNAYVLQQIKQIKEEMKQCGDDESLALIVRLQQLQEIKKILSKKLGERIILKY